MNVSRRKVLRRFAVVGGAGAVAGCTSVADETTSTTVVVENSHDEERSVTIVILDPDVDQYSDATLFLEEVQLGAGTDEQTPSQRFPDAFESQRALVEVRDRGRTDQYIYHPICSTSGSNVLRILLREPEPLYRTGCGADGSDENGSSLLSNSTTSG